MGLFKKKPIEYQQAQNDLPEIKPIQDIVKQQDKCYRILDQAASKYENDGDIDSLLSVYQKIFFDSGIELHSQTKAFYPVEICIKNGWNDKAWAYLNRLLSLSDIPVSKIRFYQGKILKKEKKYLDAVEMYMLGHLAKSEWNNTYNENLFLKDIKSCANKLKWDSDMMCCLSDLIQQQVCRRNYAEDTLIRSYRKIIKEGGG